MASICCPFLLLVAASLSMSGVFCRTRSSEDYAWTKQTVPVLLEAHTKPLTGPLFRGQKEAEALEGRKTPVCHRGRPPADRRERVGLLGYETAYENGTRTHTDISVQNFNWTASGGSAGSARAAPAAPSRRKRQVYGADGRFVISDSRFITRFPFSAAVQVSTGCSGILVSPKHVLTAAQCVHDGREYLRAVRAVRVRTLRLGSSRGGGRGRRRGGRRRVGGSDQEEAAEEEGGGREQSSVDRGGAGRRGGARARRRKGRRKKGGVAGEGGAGRKGGRRASRMRRSPRSAAPKDGIGFRWARVRQVRVPQGWIQSEGAASDYNYALLELRRPVKQKHMELGVAPPAGPVARVHFSAYDDDRRAAGGGGGQEAVVYRFCTVEEESDDMIYQRCDANTGAAGAGVYIRLKQEAPDGKGKWQRRVIAVFEGHQWLQEGGGEQRDYNAAVRITPLKYAQICHWIHADPSRCTEV